MKILITGGCGFVGHHLVNHFLLNSNSEIIVLDKLTYASFGFQRIRDINCYNDSRVRLLTTDFSHPVEDGIINECQDVDIIVHMGANSHVDRSITDAVPFVIDNVLGTTHILNFARKLPKLKRFIQFSTDEVCGPAQWWQEFDEQAMYNSKNPYAASKAGAEQMCVAYENCYKVPVFIIRSMNIFGERQHPEKFIPNTIGKVLRGEEVIIHADKECKRAGSRMYIHARNVTAAIDFLISEGETGEIYNVVGEREVDNLTLALMIADFVGKPLKYKMVDFHSSRPGHDLRYALDGRKIHDMGWRVPMTFDDSLRKTVEWTLNRPEWLEVR